MLRFYPRDMAAWVKFRMYCKLPMTAGQGYSGVAGMGRVSGEETSK